MQKKRLIFTLLVDNGSFALSRNFRLQKIGDLSWLMENYDFGLTATHIDELVILDVSRGPRKIDVFSAIVSSISKRCFIPITAGGGVSSLEHVEELLSAGADKILINSGLFERREFVRSIGRTYGLQFIVGSIDLRKSNSDSYRILINNGSTEVLHKISDVCELLNSDIIGELYLNSVDRDGTGQGLDFDLYKKFNSQVHIPIILAGGVGNSKHIEEGFITENVGAIATANLLNFIGNGLQYARESLIENGVDLPVWGNLNF